MSNKYFEDWFYLILKNIFFCTIVIAKGAPSLTFEIFSCGVPLTAFVMANTPLSCRDSIFGGRNFFIILFLYMRQVLTKDIHILNNSGLGHWNLHSRKIVSSIFVIIDLQCSLKPNLRPNIISRQDISPQHFPLRECY